MIKSDIVYIDHVLESIEAIQEFSKDMDQQELHENRLKQSAIIREIEVIGEAIKNISPNLKKKHPEIPWKDIAATRDKMIHHYFGVDFNIVWTIITIHIPDLKKKIAKIKKAF